MIKNSVVHWNLRKQEGIVMWPSYKFASWGWIQLTGMKDQVNISKSGRQNETKKMHVAQLPPELLGKIFQMLSPRDLRSVVQVCRLWREEGERPGLWTWGLVRVTAKNMSNISEVLATKRMLRVRGLKVSWSLSGEELASGELLEAVMRHRGLRHLDLRGVILSSLEPGLLARAVTGM